MAGKRAKKPIMEGLKPESEVTDLEKGTLIEMVKNCPSLWDSSCMEYKMTKDNDAIWNTFSSKMKFDCKNSFKNLRNNYTSYRRGLPSGSPGPSSTEKPKNKSFIFAEQMMFLDAHIVPRKAKVKSSMAPNAQIKMEAENKEEEAPKVDEPEDVVEIADTTPDSDDELEKKTKKRKKSDTTNMVEVLDIIVSKMPKPPVIPVPKVKVGSFESFPEELRHALVTWGNMMLTNGITGGVLKDFSRKVQREILDIADTQEQLDVLFSNGD